jgi:hypothetical protein
MIRRFVLRFSAAFVLAALAGCAAVRSAEEAVADVEQGSAQTRSYPVNEDRAEQIMRDAISEGWPDKTPEPLDDGRLGYTFQLRFAIDREHIIVEAIPTGRGLAFRVTNRGTAPIVGVPARKRLIELLEQRAGG